MDNMVSLECVVPDCDFRTCERMLDIDADTAIWVLQIHLEFDRGMSRKFTEMAAGSAEPDSINLAPTCSEGKNNTENEENDSEVEETEVILQGKQFMDVLNF